MKGKIINPKALYFSDKMQNAFTVMDHYALTVVCAPSGFGKSTFLREYTRIQRTPSQWLDIRSEELSVFWQDIVEAVFSLAGLPVPGDLPVTDDIDRFARAVAAPILSSCGTPRLLVVDQFELVCCETTKRFFFLLSELLDSRIRIILSSKGVVWSSDEDPAVTASIVVFQCDLFILSPEDVLSFFHQCGLNISGEDAAILSGEYGGLLSGLHFIAKGCLISQNYTASSKLSRAILSSLDQYLENYYDPVLLNLAPASSLSEKMLHFYVNELSDTRFEHLRELIANNPYVYCNPQTEQFHLHPLFHRYLRHKFRTLSEEKQSEIYKRMGEWCAVDKDYSETIRFLLLARDYDGILLLIENLDYVCSFFENRSVFVNCFHNCPNDALRRHPRALLKMMERFYYFNDTAMSDVALNEFSHSTHLSDISDEERSDLYFLREQYLSILSFNDIEDMTSHFHKAMDYYRPGITQTNLDIPSFYGCTMFFALFYRGGSIESTLGCIASWVRAGNRVTDNHYDGMELLARAEAAHLCCRWEQAEILLQKARWKCQATNNASAMLCIHYLDAKLSLVRGDVLQMYADLKWMREEADRSPDASSLRAIVDITECYFNMKMGKTANTADWLKKGEVLQKSLPAPIIPVSYSTYGGLLLTQKKYTQLIAIEDALQTATRRYSWVIFSIYNHIHLSLAYEAIGLPDEAEKHIREAYSLAFPEQIYMPFIENYPNLSESAIAIAELEKYPEEAETLRSYYAKYRQGLESLDYLKSLAQLLGLSTREYEVAQMASRGDKNQDIAQSLDISPNTVKAILKSVFKKLRITSRDELSQYI